MNKITRYITTGAAAMLLLMSVGAVQPNANAAQHYHAHVTRNARYGRKNYRHSRKNAKQTNHKNSRKNRSKTNNKNAKQANSKRNKSHKNKNNQVKAQKLNKRNKKAVNNTKNRYRKNARKRNAKRNKRATNRYARRLNRRNRRRGRRHARVLKPRYRIAYNNKRGYRNLQKSGWIDGSILAKIPGYDPSFANYVFSKYAPNDKRAYVPVNRDPRGQKQAKEFHITDYKNINDSLWVQGDFNLMNSSKNTKHPNTYMYIRKDHGWILLKK